MSAEPIEQDAVEQAPEGGVIHHIIPQFEGRNVEEINVVFQGKVGLDGHAPLLSVDDRIRTACIWRVTEVSHHTDADGNIVRTAKVKVTQTDIIPFTPGEDKGILRG